MIEVRGLTKRYGAVLAVDDLGFADDGIEHLTARFGFQDHVDIPRALELANGRGLCEAPVDAATATYFLSRATIQRTDAPGLAGWRKRLFAVMARNAANPAEFFGLPEDRTVTLGSRVGI